MPGWTSGPDHQQSFHGVRCRRQGGPQFSSKWKLLYSRFIVWGWVILSKWLCIFLSLYEYLLLYFTGNFCLAFVFNFYFLYDIKAMISLWLVIFFRPIFFFKIRILRAWFIRRKMYFNMCILEIQLWHSCHKQWRNFVPNSINAIILLHCLSR